MVLLVNSWGADLLTTQNYQQLGLKTLAYSLTTLLIQPGFDGLMACASLRDYVGWAGEIVLAVDCLQEEGVSFRSPRDGALIQHTLVELEALCQYLKPDVISSNVTALPLTMATQGQFFDNEQTLCIREPAFQHQHTVLQEGCTCMTCQQGLTRAYLHHLYEDVQGLAQRFIAFHNITRVTTSSSHSRQLPLCPL